jgi:hypothetical protein
MPAYDNSGFSLRGLMTPGKPEYSYGGFDDKQPLAKFLINSVAVAGNVVTATGVIVEGNLPSSGQIASVRGLRTAVAMNVTNVAIGTVTITASTGIGTIQYPATTGNIGATPDGGIMLINVAETSDTLAVGPGKQFALQHFVGREGVGRTVTWSYKFPTAPTSVTINLEVAIDDIHDTYKAIDTGSNVSGETRVVNVAGEYNFVRANITAVVGGTGAIEKHVIY